MSAPPGAAAPPAPPASSASAAPCPRRAAALDLTLVLGLELVADLGELWESRTGLPLPLGAIVARRTLPEELRCEIERLLRTSIEYAFAHREESRTYIKEHARELDDRVIDHHIDFFVNSYSLSLGDEGRRAVRELTGVEV